MTKLDETAENYLKTAVDYRIDSLIIHSNYYKLGLWQIRSKNTVNY